MKMKQTKISITDSIYRNNAAYRLKLVKSIVDDFLTALADSLKNGDTVELRGLGTFEITAVKGKKNARNPKTGEAVAVGRHCKRRFRPSKELQNAVKGLDIKGFKDEE